MSSEKPWPPPGYKILTFRVELRNPERTLTNEEVDKAMSAIVEEAEKMGAKLVTPESKKKYMEEE